MKIALIIGTRPEIVKMKPVVEALEKNKLKCFVVHTGQHYSYELDGLFFKQLRMPFPTYNVEVGSHTIGKQTGKMIEGLEEILVRDPVDMVLVLGDTNSTFAGAFIASQMHIKVGHIEAGLRSYDTNMPEEINRILTDHCSDLLFPPTERARKTLLREGILENKLFMVGNTIVDSVCSNLERIKNDDCLFPKPFLLATIHRTENVDNQIEFAKILASFQQAIKKYKMPIIYPIHPHSLKKAKEYGLNFTNINVIEPVSYLQFLKLEIEARGILTDSGGVQEEACIVGTPCLTLRGNTERPETVDCGANIVVGTYFREILDGLDYMLKNKRNWDQPYGDGKAGQRIVDIIKANL